MHAFFIDHVFFQINENQTIQRGACTIKQLIEILQTKSETITALGNGAILHKKIILEQTKKIIFPDSIPEFNTLEILITQSYQKWTNKNFDQNYTKPLYFEDLKI